MRFIKYSITIWSVEESEDNALVGISKMQCVELEEMHFNDFINGKLEILKRLINEM